MQNRKQKRTRSNGSGSLAQDPTSGVWIAFFADADGRRRKRSTRTKTRRDAELLLATWTKEIRDIRAGLVDRDAVRRKSERSRKLRDHVREYFAAFCSKGRTKQSRQVKTWALRELLRHSVALLGREPMLSDLSPDLVRRIMRRKSESGRSPRTVNFLRQNIVALAAWITQEGRANLSDLGKRVDRCDELLDERRPRRALTQDELARLFQVAEGRGRRLWYSLAYWAGLRRGELTDLRWSDVDLSRGVIRVRNSKARRIDEIPLRSDLAAELAAARPLLLPTATEARVFPVAVGRRTRRRDFERAGIPEIDADGRYADLHALRATLCTELARQLVPPTIAQRMLRHSNLQTTLRHYTRLGLTDVAAAVESMRSVGQVATLSATGTDSEIGSSSGSSSGSSRRTNGRESARTCRKGATAVSAGVSLQVDTRQEDPRSGVNRHVRLLHSPSPRALSSADEDPFA